MQRDKEADYFREWEEQEDTVTHADWLVPLSIMYQNYRPKFFTATILILKLPSYTVE